MEETLSPARNFTIRLEDRLRAAGGPPAYMRRKRAIEDIEESLVAATQRLARVASGAELLAICKKRLNLSEINRLIAIHNRYYPVEAQLPLHPRTGAMLERGQPWKPLAVITIEALVERVVAERRSA
jgi:hypothetical protein